MSNILDQFPKNRQPLPAAYQQVYQQHYQLNRQGRYVTTSVSQRLEAWMHRQVAADVRRANSDLKTLEIGAGTLNHLPYEPGVSHYDVVEPFHELYRQSAQRPRVRQFFDDIDEVPIDEKYDRIISIATFEHITDLPKVVAAAVQRLRSGGCLRVAIPNEGTSWWRWGTRITGIEFQRRYGLDYQVLMKYEHVNEADEIEMVLKYHFPQCRCKVMGLNRKWAFYRYYECHQT